MRLLLCGLLAAVLTTLFLGFASAAGAAPGGPQPCNVLIPGGSVAGTGTIVSSTSGAVTVVCHAQTASESAPPKAVQITEDTCRTVLTPSGRANEVCHVKQP